VVVSDQNFNTQKMRGEFAVRLTKQEIGRKLLHLFALLMPVGIFYGPAMHLSGTTVSIVLGSLFLSSVILEFLRLRIPAVQKVFFTMFGSILRSEESFKVTGSTWIIGAAFLCSILFSGSPHISFIALTLFVLGDAAAALVGISMGKIKIGRKTLEGSVACFIACVVIAVAVFPLVPGVLQPWGGKLPVVTTFVTALVITVFELVPLKIAPKVIINDNLAVPVIAGYVILLLEKYL
jgi:dolichol kinase